MSIKYLTYAFDARVNNPLRKLVLLKLCDNANDDGECWPSFNTISRQCEMSRSSAIRHIQALIDDGFLSSEPRFKKGEQTSNMYQINKKKLIDSGITEELPSVTVTPPLVSDCYPPSVTVTPRTVIESPDRTDNVIPIKKSRPKKQELTFPEWAESEKAQGKKLIDDSDPIFDHTEKTGVPFEFLMVAWFAFKDQYTHDNLKKQKDWRQYFRNAIKGDWLKIWAFNQNSECYLTTKGKQYQNAMGRTA